MTKINKIPFYENILNQLIHQVLSVSHTKCQDELYYLVAQTKVSGVGPKPSKNR